MITLRDLLDRKRDGRPIVMLTAYDYPLARLVAQAAVDMILVGDSGGMTQLGYANTLPVTMDEMITMVRAVRRGAPDTFVIADMPFMSYQVSREQAVANAGRLIKEGGADAVKLEGGARMAGTVRAIVEAGIPVQGHVGLTPQNATQLSGYRAQGRDERSARGFLDDCRSLEAAGAFSLIFECVPAALAAAATGALAIPTIGTGSGAGCSGQNLITPDVLGLCDAVHPRYVKRYADVAAVVAEALARYVAEVRGGAFPCDEHTYAVRADWYDDLVRQVRDHGLTAAPGGTAAGR
jgi:3-methyl-2-oxobutanoate hydroxymethyltransferase